MSRHTVTVTVEALDSDNVTDEDVADYIRWELRISELDAEDVIDPSMLRNIAVHVERG